MQKWDDLRAVLRTNESGATARGYPAFLGTHRYLIGINYQNKNYLLKGKNGIIYENKNY